MASPGNPSRDGSIRTVSAALVAVAAAALCSPGLVCGQSFRRAGTDFEAIRGINIPPGKVYSVVVTQFFHHGQIDEEGRNVAVVARNQKPTAVRVLQLGPGDFCRLAFQTLPGQSGYEILYGGEPPKDPSPPWTSKDGLLLETRQYKSCNFNSLNSVREAFNSAKPIGADYVDGVHHAGNPFSLKPGPFLSRYQGTLRISSPGTYGFFTSSQDCSFLLLDGNPVVEAPGMHPPRYRALPGSRKDVRLSAGAHSFEYYHAAAGPSAMMVAAWEVNPAGAKSQPSAIPPEAFGVAAVGHEPAGPVTMRKEKLCPDFLADPSGSVPLPDNETPLIGVQFANTSPKGLETGAKLLWEFGDGQTSEKTSPVHVYLRPGLYTVKLTARRGGKPLEIANRVYVDQPGPVDRRKLHELDDYLPILQTYDPHTLDAGSLVQLVLAYQAKAESLAAAAEERARAEASPDETGGASGAKKPRTSARGGQPIDYLTAAVDAGKVAFLEQSAAKGDEDLLRLARLIGPIARDQLGSAALAGSIWRGAAKRVASPAGKAQCQVEAADVAVNDLANAAIARPFLDAATAALGGEKSGLAASRLKRVWGDYYALAGDGKAARKAYAEAESLLPARQTNAERTAWQGAHGRSTEQYLQARQYPRAAAQIHQWQDEFPADKTVGYITLLYARYWEGRGKYPQAIALAGQLSAVNADSPYVDQLLLLAAECHVKLGAVDRAVATLQSLVKSYPGSPRVPEAKERLAELRAGKTGPSKRLRKQTP